MLTYREYYQRAQRNYTQSDEFHHDLYNHTIRWFQPGEDNELFKFPENWGDIISRASKKINKKFEDLNEHYNDPADIKALGSYSSDLAIKLKTPWNMEELEEIAQAMLPQLEKNLFHSWIHLSHLHIYRNKVSDAAETSSWLPHTDNTNREAIKMLVYLCDVDRSNGAMSYLAKDGEAIKIPTTRVDYKNWNGNKHPWPNKRAPKEVLEGLYQRGYEWIWCEGKAGTTLVFDNNILHKANINKAGPRDVANFLIRPSDHKIEKYVDLRFCGDWRRDSPLIDPEEQKVVLKDG